MQFVVSFLSKKRNYFSEKSVKLLFDFDMKMKVEKLNFELKAKTEKMIGR